jgi:hypothetical protein
MIKPPANLTLRMRAADSVGPLILFKFQQEKIGDAGALSTLRTLWFKGRNGIQLSLYQDGLW